MSSISYLSPFCKKEIHFSAGIRRHFFILTIGWNISIIVSGLWLGTMEFFLASFLCPGPIRVWRSLVSRLVRVQEAVGSNPATRTKIRQNHLILTDFSLLLFGFLLLKSFPYFPFWYHSPFDHSPTTDRKNRASVVRPEARLLFTLMRDASPLPVEPFRRRFPLWSG